MRKSWIAAAMAAGLIAGAMAQAAQAAPTNLTTQSEGWVYFNRPGATMASTEAQMAACTLAIHGWRPGQAAMISAGLLVGGIGGMMQGSILGASFEHCMVLRGWRVVRVPDDEGKALAAMKPEVLAASLKDWVGAAEPHGTVVRTWGNEAAKTETVIQVFMPGMSYREPLNVLAVTPVKGAPQSALPSPPSPLARPGRALISNTLTPAQLAAAPADSAVLIFTLRNAAPNGWTAVSFMRLGPDAVTPAYKDGRPDLIYAVIKHGPKGAPKGSPVSQTWGFIAPAGRWAMTTLSDMVVLCLGAPFFDVKAGEALNMGALEYGRDGRPIDLDAAPARTFLEGQAELAARLKPAAWTNGATFPCYNYTYALEYPDAPYAPGYERGGSPSS